MTKNFFDDLGEKRRDAFNELDRTKFGPAIRNHLVQLFRKARAVDPGLMGLIVGMGGCSAKGTHYGRYDDEPNEVIEMDAGDFCYSGGRTCEHSETADWLNACHEYDESGLACDVPILDITLDDLKTRSSEKAKVWKGRS